MKKNLYSYISMIICFCIILGNTFTIEGKSKYIQSTALEPNKVYEYDLDGDGVKEKISYEVSFEANIAHMTIRIGNKIKEKIDMTYPLEIFITECVGYLALVDMNKNDKQLELCCLYGTKGFMQLGGLVKYNKGKLKKFMYSRKDGEFDFGYTMSSLFPKKYKADGNFVLEKHQDALCTDGKGQLFFTICSPYQIYGIGAHAVLVPFIVKGNALVPKKVKEYEFFCRNPYIDKSRNANVNDLLNEELDEVLRGEIERVYNDKDEHFILNKKCALYTKPSKSAKKIRIMEEDEKIKIIKIRPQTEPKYQYCRTAYAYIQDQKGRKGWIFIDKVKHGVDDLFKNTLFYLGGKG